MAGAGRAIKRAAERADLSLGNIGIGLGILAAGRLAKGIRGRRPDLDAEAARTRLSPQSRSPTDDAVYIVGRAKVGGRVLHEQEKFFRKGGGDTYKTPDKSPTRYFYQAALLADHKIGGIEKMWFGGLEVPLQVGSAVGSTHLTRLRSDYATPPVAGVPPTASSFFGDRLAALKGAIDALKDRIETPPEDPDDTPTVTYQAPADIVLRRLYDELVAERAALQFSGRTDIGKPGAVNWWLHAPKFGGLNYVDVWPTIRLTWSDGTHETQDATSSVDLDSRARTILEGWGTADRVEGVAWLLLEIRTFLQKVDGAEDLYPFGGLTRIPEARYLVPGDPALGTAAIGTQPVGAWGASPIKWAEWFMKDRCRIPDERVADFTAAAAVGDVVVPARGIAADDPTTPDKDHPITWPQMQDAFFGAGAVVETSVRDRFIAEFNRRYMKARPTYFAEGLLSGSMSRDAVLEALGAACAGSFPYYGGQWHAHPGQYVAPAFTIVEADLLDEEGAGRVEWGVQGADLTNTLRCSLGQDRDSNWEPADAHPVGDPALVEAHGKYERELGVLQLVSDQQQARHLMHVQLRRDAYGLRRCTVRAKMEDVDGRDTPFVAPGDYVLLNVEGESLTMQCEEATAELASFKDDAGKLEHLQTLTLAERPSNTFDWSWLPPTIAREDALPPENPEDPTHWMRATARFVEATGGWWLEISPEYGPDVQSAHFEIDYAWVGEGDAPASKVPLSFATTVVRDNPATPDVDEGVALPAVVHVPRNVVGNINQSRASGDRALFTEGEGWEIKARLTGYGEALLPGATFDAAQAGTAGEPFELVLGGPGVPSDDGQVVDFNAIGRPGDIDAPSYVTNMVIDRVRTTDGGTLVWKWSDTSPATQSGTLSPSEWTVVVHDVSQSALDDNYSILTQRSLDPPGWRFVIINLFKQPRNRSELLFSSRHGSAGAYTYTPPLAIPLFKDFTPAETIRIVTAKPTTAGRFDRELAFTVEAEE